MWTCPTCSVANWDSHAWCHKCWAWRKGGGRGGKPSKGDASSATSAAQPSDASSPSLSLQSGPVAASTEQQPPDKVKAKEKEKEARSIISALTISYKAFPKDDLCTPAMIALKKGLWEQIEEAKKSLRALKPLSVRMEKTQAFIDKKRERLQAVETELQRLVKEQGILTVIIAENTKALQEMKEISDAQEEDAEIGDKELAELLAIALSSGNARAQKIAGSIQHRIKLESVVVEDSDSDMEVIAAHVPAAAALVPAAAAPTGHGPAAGPGSGVCAPPAAPKVPKVVCGTSQKGVCGTPQKGLVKTTIEKINKTSDRSLAPFRSRGRAQSVEPGFPRVGQDENDL